MDKLQCEQNCIHCPVCGHKEQFKKFFDEHISLRRESVLFDGQPKCQFYLNENDIERKHTHDISDVYKKVKEVTEKEPIVLGSENDLNKLHNNSDKDEITIAKDNSLVNLEECIDRYYVLKNQINELNESLAKCIIKKEKTEDVEDNKKQLNILNSKLEARQQRLKDVKAIIKITLDCFKCGGGLNYKKYNMLLEERVELENEIGELKSEIHSIEFAEKLNDKLEKLHPRIRIYTF
jgi:hypothetical protein